MQNKVDNNSELPSRLPDNLKSAVTKSNHHDPILNKEFARFAEHYGIVGFPACVRKPKDKSPVENAVKLTYKDIFTALEGLHYSDVASLNVAIHAAQERLNTRGRPQVGREHRPEPAVGEAGTDKA